MAEPFDLRPLFLCRPTLTLARLGLQCLFVHMSCCILLHTSLVSSAVPLSICLARRSILGARLCRVQQKEKAITGLSKTWQLQVHKICLSVISGRLRLRQPAAVDRLLIQLHEHVYGYKGYMSKA